MLDYLFSNKNVEKILMYILLQGKANATELHRAFGSALDPIQKTLRKLEEGRLLVSFFEGKTRVFQWNTKYPFLKEVQALAEKAYSYLPEEMQRDQYQVMRRKRPRKTGKPL